MSEVIQLAPPHGRVPPNNLDAERSLLGGLLLDSAAFAEVRPIVAAEDFYRDAHRKVFEAMCRLDDRSEPIDRVTVKATLVASGAFESVGGDEYVDLLDKFVPTAANLEYYAKIIADKARARRLIEAAGSIAQLGYEQHGDVDDFADESERRIFAATARTHESDFSRPRDLIAETTRNIEARYERNTTVTGLPSKLAALDEMTCGFQPMDLVVIAARPSMGKSSLALDILAETCGDKGAAALFSLEVSKQGCIEKLLAREARIDLQSIRSGQFQAPDWERMAVAMGRVSDWDLFIDDQPAQSAQLIRSKARRLAARLEREGKKLRAVAVDYLQLMGGDKNLQREERVSENTRAMKALAKELGIPVFLLSQLNREVEKRPDKRPMMSDLRESGAVEQDADAILFIYRGEFYEKDNAALKGKAEIIIGKQRMGPVGTAQVAWIAQYTTFCNLGQEPVRGQMRLPEPPPHTDEDRRYP